MESIVTSESITSLIPHSVTLGAVTVLVAACSLIILYRLLLNPLSHIPGPLSTRVSGLRIILEGIKGRRIYELEALHNKYGSIVRVGPKEVSVRDWQHLRTLYANSKLIPKDPAFYEAASFIGQNNIFQMTNPIEHGARRKLSNPSYSFQSITRLDAMIKEKSEYLARRLLNEASSSPTKTTDAYKLCGIFSFEVICKAAFGRDFQEATTDELAPKLLQAMEGSALTLLFDNALPFLKLTGLGRKLPGPIGNAYRNLYYWEEQSRKMVDHFLAEHSSDQIYLLSPIATKIDGFLGRKLNHEELVEEAMGYMFAGSGTTSSTLTYLLYALSLPENAHIQEQLRSEIGKLGFNDLSAVRQNLYLNAVIKETFRRFPSIASTLPRVLLEPLFLGKHLLPKGTVISMQNWTHHRDPAVFPDPDRFLPERWLQSNDAMEGSLTPFSVGRRNCIGQNLAREELYIAISVIMRAGLRLRIGPEMQPGEMEIEDRFSIAPRGHRLMLQVTRPSVL